MILPFKFSKPNKKIYTFLKHPDFKLEPQAQCILNTIERESPINRYTLCMALSDVLETCLPVSQVLSYHQTHLVKYGCILVETPEEYKERCKNHNDQLFTMMIIPNTFGNWSIRSMGGEKPTGNFATIADARRAIERDGTIV